jgi:hypothetical protein
MHLRWTQQGWIAATKLRCHLPHYAKWVHSGEIPASQGRNKGAGTWWEDAVRHINNKGIWGPTAFEACNISVPYYVHSDTGGLQPQTDGSTSQVRLHTDCEPARKFLTTYSFKHNQQDTTLHNIFYYRFACCYRWHVPDAVCTVFELLMMGGETARNM